eukprot:jgi/Hompol1/2285/HPOL_002140-RA
MLLALLASLLPLVAADIGFQQAPNCGLPADPVCLIKNAQYTGVGTIISNNLSAPGVTPDNYNATVRIRCLWASFSTPASPGAGLVGSSTGPDLLVANWGFPKPGCPANTGSQALVNTSKILFFYVAAPAPSGSSPDKAIFAVQDPCVGGLDYTPQNLQLIANVLAQNPQNAIPSQNSGPASQCALPSVPSSTIANTPATATGTVTGSVTVPGAATSVTSTGYSLIVAAIGAAIGALALIAA